MEELSQLDELVESDILEALGENAAEPINQDLSENIENESDIILEDFEEDENTTDISEESIPTQAILDNSQTQTLNTNDLASLLSQLLNNKTIEITIKIKD